MKNKKIIALVAALAICVLLAGALAACATDGQDGLGIKSIEKTGTSGLTDTYTVTYTDGSTFTFQVTNGANGENGADGADGESVSALDIYNQYIASSGDDSITYQQFIDAYMDVEVAQDNSAVIASVLRSVASVNTEFYETRTSVGWGGITTTNTTALYSGSAVIYKIDGDYTYFITNYHVVYSSYANADNLAYSESGADSQNIARKIVIYLYGSENDAKITESTENNYNTVDYGSYAIECEYAGGSEQNDIALIRAKTSDVKAINPDVQPVTFADGYDVGDTAIVIGNTGGDGISVTEGIVSVHSEYITLQISQQITAHRSMRVDASMYGGNSGGGCFNVYGELIGVPHAGNGEEEQSINYAVPVDTVKAAADNIYYYATDSDPSTSGLNAIALGVTVSEENSRYIYNEATGSGEIVTQTVIQSITSGGIAEQLGLQTGDIITSITLTSGGASTQISIDRNYMVTYATYAAKAGDTIAVSYTRGGTPNTTAAHTVTAAEITVVG